MCRYTDTETLCGVPLADYSHKLCTGRRFRLYLCPETRRDILASLERHQRTTITTRQVAEIHKGGHGKGEKGKRTLARKSKHERRDQRLLRSLAVEAGLNWHANGQSECGRPTLKSVLDLKFGDAVEYLLSRALASKVPARREVDGFFADISHVKYRNWDMQPVQPVMEEAFARGRGAAEINTDLEMHSFGSASSHVEKLVQRFSRVQL